MNKDNSIKYKNQNLNKSNIDSMPRNHPLLNTKSLNKDQSSPKSADVTINEIQISKDKDFEVKLEKALFDLSEHKNNFYKDKFEIDKQIEQTKIGKTSMLKQSFYGGNLLRTNVNFFTGYGLSDPTNTSTVYSPGYRTGLKTRPATQDKNGNRATTPSEENHLDGDILSNIDMISNNELKERLVVAEMIMKKLYLRNKDLEVAIDKTQNKIRDPIRSVSSNLLYWNLDS